MKKGKAYILLGVTLMLVATLFLSIVLAKQFIIPLVNQKKMLDRFYSELKTPVPTKVPTDTIATITSARVSTVTPEPTKIYAKDNYLLEIPSINLSEMVHHITPDEKNSENWGIPKKILDEEGVVDYPNLSFPGEEGITSIAGHRDISGSPFLKFDQLNIGDNIYITLKNGDKIEYSIYNILIVDPADTIFSSTEYNKELRLVTCEVGDTTKRVFVFAYQTN